MPLVSENRPTLDNYELEINSTKKLDGEQLSENELIEIGKKQNREALKKLHNDLRAEIWNNWPKLLETKLYEEL